MLRRKWDVNKQLQIGTDLTSVHAIPIFTNQTRNKLSFPKTEDFLVLAFGCRNTQEHLCSHTQLISFLYTVNFFYYYFYFYFSSVNITEAIRHLGIGPLLKVTFVDLYSTHSRVSLIFLPTLVQITGTDSQFNFTLILFFLLLQ